MTADELHPLDNVIVRHDPGKRPPRVARVLFVRDGLAFVRIFTGLGRVASRATRVPLEQVVRAATDREAATGMPAGLRLT